MASRAHPPTHILALAVCALALLLGVSVADDYGIFIDTYDQHEIGHATLQHLAGKGGLNLLPRRGLGAFGATHATASRGLNLLVPGHERLYGPVFETLLALVERLLGLDDSRHIMFSRHLLTHLFFIVAGFAGYLLACRLFGNRWLALFALLLFLLHPRIYAHSFFNTKDAPFLATFMICLWLAYRAFDPPGASGAASAAGKNAGAAMYGAFALCGVAAGLLTNLRVMGLVFFAAVVFMRLCDAVGAETWDQRKRAVASCAVFAFAAAGAYYATMPYLWADPLTRFVEILRVLSAHPNDIPQLFQGKLVFASELPPSYLPVWFGITTPPLALLFGAIGLAALVWRIVPRPLASLSRNTPLRFELLIGACLFLPVLTTVVLQPITYDGWRHFHFLWAPFVLLATSGLGTLLRSVHRLGWTRGRAAVASLAALGLGATAVEMARLHPYQHLGFNVLATGPGTATPVFSRFQLDFVSTASPLAHVLEGIAGRGDILNVKRLTLWKLQRGLYGEWDEAAVRARYDADWDIYVMDHRQAVDADLFPPLLYERRLYGKPIAQVATPDLSRIDEATAQSYRALYREVTSNAPSLSGADVNIHVGEMAVFWAMEPCLPGDVNKRRRMAVVPLDAQSPTQIRPAYGVRVGDACLWKAPLPDYPIAKMLFPYIGGLATDAHIEERRRRYQQLSATPPAARSTFDVYLEDRTLLYLKTPCVQQDADAPFFVHVWPEHVVELPHTRRRHGFDALDFRFGGFDPQWNYASSDIFDGVCMATLELPDYPVANITTGQYLPGGAGLWQVEIAVTDG